MFSPLDLIQHSTLSLTSIAYNCRFSDQSHFIKTFKSLAQMTPG
ncbi:MAG: helix-turn-helix domain-containing protein [Bacteroidota bacterium]